MTLRKLGGAGKAFFATPLDAKIAKRIAEDQSTAQDCPDTLAAPIEIKQALKFFHQRLLPDLVLDVGMVRAMLNDADAE